MFKLILVSAAALAIQSTAFAESLAVKDNLNATLTLSQNNYNHLYIKGDEIWDFAFPKGALGIKKDKADGSIYFIPGSNAPFTLFLTTKNGHHYTMTVNSEEALGKTIELIPEGGSNTHQVASRNKSNPAHSAPLVPEAIAALLNHMQRHEPLTDLKVSHHFGKAERWEKGLSLVPKETWEGQGLKGEFVELYNGGNAPIVLSQAWFAKDNTLAIQFSKPTLLPHEHAMLYRIAGVGHG